MYLSGLKFHEMNEKPRPDILKQQVEVNLSPLVNREVSETSSLAAIKKSKLILWLAQSIVQF